MRKKKYVCVLMAIMLAANSITVFAGEKIDNHIEGQGISYNDTPNMDSNEVDEDTPEGVTGWYETEGGWKYQYGEGCFYSNEMVEIDGKYYYFDEDGYRAVGWILLESSWYLFSASGERVSGWIKDNGYWYYLDEDGQMLTGWQYIDEGWYYFSGSGKMQTGWISTGNKWYYLQNSGKMSIGWQKVGNHWYYLKESGAMAIGWEKIKEQWYLFADSGKMKTGWYQSGNKWYYLRSDGSMAIGWEKSGSTWYYFKDSGNMATGWQFVDGNWYYLKDSGAMSTGWLNQGDHWYYLKNSGKMAIGWEYISGYKYYFNSNGSMCDDLRGMVSGPYYIMVNRKQNCVTVYAKDGDNGYIIPIKAFLCSTGGTKTPLGTFTMSTQYRWHQLYGAAGQYCSRITGHVLFHSVPYYTLGDNHSLMPGQFNRLGTNASAGCVRLCTGDAKWIYDNCSTGSTQITIYDGESSSPLGRPSLPKIPYNQNWDPTDPSVY